jgi:transcriptional regulator with XRE-family HTH domain
LKSSSWDAFVASPEGRRSYEHERVMLEATEVLCRLMESRRVTSAELARRLGVTPARVSQLLSGSRNLTLASLAGAFHVLGRSMHVVHGPPTERVIVHGRLVERARSKGKVHRSIRRRTSVPRTGDGGGRKRKG